jgi:hypothetical protein
MNLREAIRAGDVDALLRLLAEDVTLANTLIRWGTNDCVVTHPLHYVSDMLFEGTLRNGKELAIIRALVAAGADLNFQRNGKRGKSDTPLIGAASLGAEDVGLVLLEAGAKPELSGAYGETALHWAALLGEDRLVRGLIPGSDVNLKDNKYQSSPLGWAVHGWCNPPAGSHGRQREAASALISAGAIVEKEWLEEERIRADASMMATLRVGI